MQERSNWFIPIAIIVAGGLIALSLFLVKKGAPQSQTAAVAQSVDQASSMPPVTAADHILGNPNSQIYIVEYGDTDCPYCQEYQSTLHQIITDYGNGQVAWVYRDFAIHPNSPKEAEATECVAELGGNDKFWQYLDLLFSKKDFTVTPYIGLDPSQLPVLAASIGIDQNAFTTCLNSGKYESKITEEYNDAIAAGAQGTPFTIIVTRNSRIPITTGAVSYTELKAAIDAILNSNT